MPLLKARNEKKKQGSTTGSCHLVLSQQLIDLFEPLRGLLVEIGVDGKIVPAMPGALSSSYKAEVEISTHEYAGHFV